MKILKLLAVCLFSSSLLLSCSDDDKETTVKEPIENPGDNTGGDVTLKSEWVPSNIKVESLLPIPPLDYPHAAGCNEDFLQLYSNNTGKFTRHSEDNCKPEVIEQAFTRNGNNVTLTLMGYTVAGTIEETASEMIITSSGDAYIPIIKIMYPDAAQIADLLKGSKVKLTFTKKN